jgi:transposase
LVQRALLGGAAAYGWQTEVWTLERVADVIAMETGIWYHIAHVWKIMRRLALQ